MSDSKSQSRSPKGSNLEKALAALIASTHNKRRPMPLTQVAEWLDVALAELGSYRNVGERIGVSAKMLRQFNYMHRLSPVVRGLFHERKIDSVDAAAHLAMLELDDQEAAASQLVAEQIDTQDLRAIVQLRKSGDSSPIAKLITRVKRSKTKRLYVAEFVVREARNRLVLLAMFRRYIRPEDIVKLELRGSLGRLFLTSKGKGQLGRAAKALGVPLRLAVQRILTSKV